MRSAIEERGAVDGSAAAEGALDGALLAGPPLLLSNAGASPLPPLFSRRFAKIAASSLDAMAHAEERRR